MKTLALAALVALLAGSATPPGKVEYDVEKGLVTFDHAAHVARREKCRTCHGDGTARKLELGKRRAHTLCVGCHAAGRAGPKACGECHEE